MSVTSTRSRPSFFSSKIVSKALVRDNFRCIVSGRYDSQSVQANHELKEEVRKSRSLTSDTQGAHIFPQSTNMNVSGSNEDRAKVCFPCALLPSQPLTLFSPLARVCRVCVGYLAMFRL